MNRFMISIAVVLAIAPRSSRAEMLAYGSWMNSGDIAVQFGHWLDRICTAGRCITPTQVTPAPSGFAKADMLITGFEVNYVNAAAPRPVALSSIALVPETYDPTASMFSWHLTSDVRAAATTLDAYSVDVHFAIVLSDQKHAVVNDGTVGCSGRTSPCGCRSCARPEDPTFAAPRSRATWPCAATRRSGRGRPGVIDARRRPASSPPDCAPACAR